jgi:hypothetical protein
VQSLVGERVWVAWVVKQGVGLLAGRVFFRKNDFIGSAAVEAVTSGGRKDERSSFTAQPTLASECAAKPLLKHEQQTFARVGNGGWEGSSPGYADSGKVRVAGLRAWQNGFNGVARTGKPQSD